MYSIIDMTSGALIAQTKDEKTAVKLVKELNDLQKGKEKRFIFQITRGDESVD